MLAHGLTVSKFESDPTFPTFPVATNTKSIEYRFGHFMLQPAERRLLVRGEIATLAPRAFDVLVALVARAGRLVTKHELLDLVWPGLVVEENNLQVQVSALRKVLGPEVIATIPGRGYRFVLQLEGNVVVSPMATIAPDTTTPAHAELKTNLPDLLPPLIGRDADLAALGALIGKHRLITITGAGGMGKTRLAQHLLHERRNAYADGAAWVDLSSLSDAALLPSAIGGALGLQMGSGDSRKALVAAMQPLSVLVALDNAERVVDEAAGIAQSLLDGAPQLRLLVTSQVPLKLSQERVYRLAPLAVPEADVPLADALSFGAVALFAERAQAADRRFALTEQNVVTVIDICRNLDGMALALELAAARVPLLGVTQLAAALDQRLRVLTVGNRSALARQQTLRAELEWSHDLLGPAEQVVFHRLGVFAGGFTLAMAQHVVPDRGAEIGLDEWAVVDALGALVDRSLVVADDAEPPRYRLLESPRAFALDRLTAAGEVDAMHGRHALAVVARFTQVEAASWDGKMRVDDAIAALEPDLDNAREALAWALAQDAPTAVALAPLISFALTRARYLEQSRLWDATGKRVTEDLPVPLRAAWALGYSAFFEGRKARLSTPRAREAIALYRRLGDRVGLYRALGALCRSDFARDTHAAQGARDALTEMRALEDLAWPVRLRCLRAIAAAVVEGDDGAFDAALEADYRALTMSEQAGDSDGVTSQLIGLADTELRAGHADDAVRHGLALEMRLRGTRKHYDLTLARMNLTGAWLAKDAVAEARAVAAKGLPLAAQAVLLHSWAEYMALLAVLERRPRSAARLLGYSDAIHTANNLVQQANEANAFERAKGLAREALGDAEFARLKSEGADLRDEDVAALALAAQDS